MEEIIIDKVEWSAPEYKHKEKSMDFLWAIGLVSLIVCGLAIWFQNYLFAVFVFIAGGTLVLFSVRHPQEVHFVIETNGITLGKDKYPWKRVKGFHIKKEEDYAVLLIELDKYLLPIYTIPLPIDQIPQVKESLLKILPNIDLDESKSMKFMEKLGF
jgi:hypothetical protein